MILTVEVYCNFLLSRHVTLLGLLLGLSCILHLNASFAFFQVRSRFYVTCLSKRVLYVLCPLQGNLTMWSMKTRTNSLEYTMQEIPLSMNVSRKSNKPTRVEYLLVSQTMISTKYTLEV